MKAVVRYRYGPPDLLRLEEIPKPDVLDDELLIKVQAASLNLGDWEILTADPLYIAVMAQLLNGAGGGAGTFAVQIAKSIGAEVTGVDSGHKMDMLRSIGTDHVIDYTREDFTRTDKRYDLIFDLAAHRSVQDCRRVLNLEGLYLAAGGSLRATIQTLLLSSITALTGNRRAMFLMAEERSEDLVRMTDLIQAGKVTPVVDRTYPLSETAEALRCVGEGRSSGKIVITVE